MKSLLLKMSCGFLLASGSVSAWAQAPSLRLPNQITGSRPASLGGAFTAVADDQNALFYNPAGLARLDSWFGALAELNFSASFGSSGLGQIFDDADKIAAHLKEMTGGADISKQIDGFIKIGDVISSRTAALGARAQHYVAARHWGLAQTESVDFGLGVHAKLLPELADLGLVADSDTRAGYAHSFLDGRVSIGAAPYYKLRAQGGRANLKIDEAIEPKSTLKNIIAIGQGVGLDVGLMVTPIEAMSPTFGLAIQNVGDTKFYEAGRSAFANLPALKGSDFLGTPDLIKQIVNVGFSISPIDGPGFVRLSGEMREINRPSSAALKPAFGVEGGFRSKYVRALVDAGWGNGNWSAGFELRAFIKMRFATYIEPNLFFDRKENQRVWVVSLGM